VAVRRPDLRLYRCCSDDLKIAAGANKKCLIEQEERTATVKKVRVRDLLFA
jgi:hypothetical protein